MTKEDIVIRVSRKALTERNEDEWRNFMRGFHTATLDGDEIRIRMERIQDELD